MQGQMSRVSRSKRKCIRWQLPDGVRGARLTAHGGEPHGYGSSFSDGGEYLCLTVSRNVVGNFEITERTCGQAKGEKMETILDSRR